MVTNILMTYLYICDYKKSSFLKLNYLNFEHKLVMVSVNVSISWRSIANEVNTNGTVHVDQSTDGQYKGGNEYKNCKVFALLIRPRFFAVIISFITMIVRQGLRFEELH